VVEGYAMPLRYKHYEFFLSHYPTVTDHYKEGESLHNHVIDLCGHTHTDDRFADFDNGLIYHVELYAHDNRPVRIDQIIEDIKDKCGVK
jgi:calcineurin-like phosphoesterase family protein